MGAGRVAFVDTRAGAGQFVGTRTGVSRDMQPGVVVHPVNQPVLENRIRSRDALWNRERVADFARVVWPGDVDRAQAMPVPRVEDQILERRRIVILLRHSPPRLTARLGVRLIEAL